MNEVEIIVKKKYIVKASLMEPINSLDSMFL